MRRPLVSGRLGLGVGLDLPWGARVGFRRDPADGVTESVVRFLNAYADAFSYLFVSWQPKNRNRLDAREYAGAYDDLFARAPDYAARALHQTALNLGALERYDRRPILELTNALIERHRLSWVNEDLGLWSLHGRPLPYPLPPFLTPCGLGAAVKNVAEVQARLSAPLLLEFPGFSHDESLVIGELHAYDFFREVVEATGTCATLDVGHLLSYQWLRGRRGEALYQELERLPVAHCFEIHLSGCAIEGDRFMDFHHGVLLHEQLELLARLLPLCPNLSAVTYEDPKFDDAGELLPATRPGFERLRALTEAWCA
jgi:uncharacterized protein